MIDLDLFLQDLLIQGVELWIEGDRLQVRPPQGGLSPEAVALLSQYESEMVRLLPTFSFETPLSYGQEALWFIHQNIPNKAAYNIAMVLHLKNGVDKALLCDVLQKIVGRHSALRTTIAASHGKPKQVIHATQTLCFSEVDCSGQSWEIVMQAVEEAYQRPFDLSEGPLWRATLVSQSPDSQALLLSFHHIIFDGWSMWMLLDEFLALYAAGAARRAANLPPIRSTYPQFVQWQGEFLEASLNELRVYWQKVLEGQEGQLPVLELPTDHPRPAFPTSQGNSVPFQLASELRDQLRALARLSGVSFYTVLLAAFQVLLARYSGQNQLLVGVPTAGRTEEFDQIFGYFVNEVVVRGDLENAPSFTTFLSQVRANLLGAIKHRAYPFPWLVRDLLPSEREASRAPIFQAMLTVQRPQPLKDNTRRLLKGEQVPLGSASGAPLLSFVKWWQVTRHLDIELDLMEQDEGLVGYFRYNADIFEAETIERMGGHFKTLLAGVVANPEQAVHQLPLLTEAERQQQLVEWNDTAVPCPTDTCFHQLFEAQVARTPDAEALVYSVAAETLTYRELNERANQVAHHLRALGVKPEVVVGVCMERCTETVISLLAIFKAGGVYIPLDPALPQERLSYMLTNSAARKRAEAKVVLTKSAYVEKLSSQFDEDHIVHLNRDWEVPASSEMVARQPKTNLPNLSTPQNLAYVIYTSGSTGLPKGAMIEHQGMVNHLYTKIIDLKMSAGDRLAETAPQSFDISIWQFLSALLVGGAVHIFDDETVRNPAQLLARTEAEKITILEVVPSLFRFMLDELETLGPNRPGFSALRWLMLTGEALPPHLCREWFPYYPDIPLVNAYGPTECSDDVTHHIIYEAPPANAVTVPIGRAVPNMRLYILDSTMQPVPIGVPGELYVGGIGVGRGYLNDPERTANAFMDDPFSPPSIPPNTAARKRAVGEVPHARFYKTGDLVRYRPDGTIEFLGRLDHQVKIRGHRIELGEIEGVLAKHPAVRQSLVIAKENGPADYSLVAYVALNRSNDVSLKGPRTTEVVTTVTELRHYLSQTLPDYMIPAAFVTLDAFPLTPNGKVDRQMLDALPLTPSGKINRRALPAPDEVLGGLEEGYIAPRTPTEEIVSAIFQEVLKVGRVSRDANFFELGGHSLLATQVISRLREAFRATPHASCPTQASGVGQQARRVALPVRTIFEAPTVAELAEAIASARQAEQQLPVPPPIQAIERVGGLPLSFAQLRLWFLAQITGPSPTYSLPMVLRLSGSLQVSALEQALGEIMRRHEILRTTFPIVEGLPVQRINPDLSLPLPVVSLQHLAEAEQTKELNRRLASEAVRPFDLAQGPLLRVGLYVLSDHSIRDGNYALFLNMHHIISDGWSLGVLWQELDSLYQAFAASQPSPLPELSVQYADFAHWQREWLQGEVLEKQLTYWQQQLANAPTLLELPTDRARNAVQTFNGQVEPFEISPQLADNLRLLSRRSGTSLFMSLYGAFSVLLGRLCGQEDLVIGTPIANRNYHQIEPLIGFFVNTLPLRADLSGNPSFLDLLGRVRQVTLDAYAHQDIPFEQLVDHLAVERQLSHTPLFQVVFMWQNEPLTPTKLGDLTASLAELDTVTAKFDLTLALEENQSNGAEGSGLRGAIEYNTDLFDQSTIKRMIGHFKQLLAGIVADPTQPINQLSILTFASRQQLLVTWNNTQAPYPTQMCMQHLFEAQVERTPSAVALTFGEVSLTYHELNQRANKLAYQLIELGVGPEVMVGLCASRGVSMIVGLLAILKAGGAYVALDPAYPKERQALALQDAKVSILLTQQHLADTLPTDGLTLLFLDQATTERTRPNPVVSVAPHNLAYILYTSGSTGRPKGVAIEHRSAVALLSWAQSVFPADQLAGVLASTSICFDLSVFDIFLPLSCGGTVILAENALALPTLPASPPVTLINTVPSAMRELVRMNGVPASVRVVNLAGEPLPNRLVQAVYAQETVEKVYNLYGPSEDTTYSTFVLTKKGSLENPTIGRPIANTQVYLLDSALEPVPIGLPGQLYLGGAGLARGYLNRPELTAQRFIDNPFADGRLYNTGDLARYLPDGNIQFLGRIDHQIKLRGIRIELGEIETFLSQHLLVQETVVIVRENQPGDKRLVAYVVLSTADAWRQAAESLPQDRTPAVIPELRAHLKQKLPDYMVPAAFVLLESLPLTPNGKVDRRALPAPDQMQATADYVSPQSDLEKAIANVWQEVLGLPKARPEGRGISIHDNFFDVGGHSLLAVQIQSKLQATLDTDLTITDFFAYPTIASLAEQLSSNARPDKAKIGQAQQTQPEKSLWEANQSRSQARRAALKERVTRQPRRRNR